MMYIILHKLFWVDLWIAVYRHMDDRSRSRENIWDGNINFEVISSQEVTQAEYVM